MSDNSKIDYIQERVDSVAESLTKIDKDAALQRAAFDSHTKQDEQMYDELKRMNDILQQNTNSLKEHMSRTIILEEMAKKMDDRLNAVEVDRIQKAAISSYFSSKLKLITKVGAAVGFLAGAWVWLWPTLQNLIR